MTKCNHEFNFDYLSRVWTCNHCGVKHLEDDRTDYVQHIENHISPSTVVIEK